VPDVERSVDVAVAQRATQTTLNEDKEPLQVEPCIGFFVLDPVQ